MAQLGPSLRPPQVSGTTPNSIGTLSGHYITAMCTVAVDGSDLSHDSKDLTKQVAVAHPLPLQLMAQLFRPGSGAALLLYVALTGLHTAAADSRPPTAALPPPPSRPLEFTPWSNGTPAGDQHRQWLGPPMLKRDPSPGGVGPSLGIGAPSHFQGIGPQSLPTSSSLPLLGRRPSPPPLLGNWYPPAY